ncbi:hypothetical protein C8J57DRAFT_1536708 [Mycena rebaudengoi]|nr:hypothetical protein C8J57DRAFT_1536708 [Mycena rebaudengoi]
MTPQARSPTASQTLCMHARTATPPHGAPDTHTDTVHTHTSETLQHADDTARRIEIPATAQSISRLQMGLRLTRRTPKRPPSSCPHPHRAPLTRSHTHPPRSRLPPNRTSNLGGLASMSTVNSHDCATDGPTTTGSLP